MGGSLNATDLANGKYKNIKQSGEWERRPVKGREKRNHGLEEYRGGGIRGEIDITNGT